MKHPDCEGCKALKELDFPDKKIDEAHEACRKGHEHYQEMVTSGKDPCTA